MTTPLPTFIVDDEPLAIKVLEKHLTSVPELQLQASFTNPLEALPVLREQQEPCLLLLDINMPEIKGTSLLRSLRSKPLVIFTTAYAEYAVESYELDAVDYLLKPVSLERFLQASQRALERVAQPPAATLPATGFLSLRVDRRLHKVPYADIELLEAYDDYVKVHTRSSGLLLPKATLSQLAAALPATQFLQVHRSFVVNLQQVRFLEGNLLQVASHKVPVSKTYREVVVGLF